MIRTQVQLTDEQARRIKRRAAERGVSMAAAIREAIAQALDLDDAADRRRRALEAVGGFHSGLGDVSNQHDRHLAKTFGE